MTSNLSLDPWSYLWPEFDLQLPFTHPLNIRRGEGSMRWLNAGEKVTAIQSQRGMTSRASRAPFPPLPPQDPRASVRNSETPSLLPSPEALTSHHRSLPQPQDLSLSIHCLHPHPSHAHVCLDNYRSLGWASSHLHRAMEPVFMLYELDHSPFTPASRFIQIPWILGQRAKLLSRAFRS